MQARFFHPDGQENRPNEGAPTEPAACAPPSLQPAAVLTRSGSARSMQLGLSVDVSCQPGPHPKSSWGSIPLSCPSRLQAPPGGGSPSHATDAFGAAADPGATPMVLQPTRQPLAPRKQGTEASPEPALRPAVLFADCVQSCPAQPGARRGTRPLVRLRAKRSLNLPHGASAAAAASSMGGAPPSLARCSADAAGALPPLPQLAGCSRKRFEAELVSPLQGLPRKASRTMEDQAAEAMARLALASEQQHGGLAGAAAAGATAQAWAAAAAASRFGGASTMQF